MFDDYAALFGLLGTVITLSGWVLSKIKEHINLQEVIRDPLTYFVLIINLLITTSLLLSLRLEFPYVDDGKYAPFLFYYEHYPHIVIYPALMFGFASLFILRATLIRWSISKTSVILRVVLAVLIAFIAMYYEATGGYMMLFEFNRDAQVATSQFNDEPVLNKAKKLGIGESFTSPMAEQFFAALASSDGNSKVAISLNNYEAWEKLDVHWKSSSRQFYLAIFCYMVFIIVLGFTLLPPIRNPIGGDNRADLLTSLNLAGAYIIFLMWMPFRMFYNLHTKIPIFGSRVTDNFLGHLPFFKMAGLLPSDVIPILLICCFLIFLALRVADLPKSILAIVLSVICLSIIVISAILAVLYPSTFIDIFGLNTDLKYLSFRIIILSLLLFLVYDFMPTA